MLLRPFVLYMWLNPSPLHKLSRFRQPGAETCLVASKASLKKLSSLVFETATHQSGVAGLFLWSLLAKMGASFRFHLEASRSCKPTISEPARRLKKCILGDKHFRRKSRLAINFYVGRGGGALNARGPLCDMGMLWKCWMVYWTCLRECAVAKKENMVATAGQPPQWAVQLASKA